MKNQIKICVKVILFTLQISEQMNLADKNGI